MMTYKCTTRLVHQVKLEMVAAKCMFIYIFINIWLAIKRLNKYILYVDGLSKGTPATSSVKNEMKSANEKMTWNTQDMNLSWYVHKANVEHTISGQQTAISTLDYSTTTPRAPFHIPY